MFCPGILLRQLNDFSSGTSISYLRCKLDPIKALIKATDSSESLLYFDPDMSK